eukprot:403336652
MDTPLPDDQSVECCFICGIKFNNRMRKQVMLPCGDEVCLFCLHPKLSPQDDEFHCAACNENIKIPNKFKQNLLKQVEKHKRIRLNCKEHHNKKAHYYCKKCSTHACNQCVLFTHNNHQEQIQILTPEQISDCLKDQLSNLKQKINQFGVIYKNMENFENQLDGIDFKEFQDTLLKTVEILPDTNLKKKKKLYFLKKQPNSNQNSKKIGTEKVIKNNKTVAVQTVVEFKEEKKNEQNENQEKSNQDKKQNKSNFSSTQYQDYFYEYDYEYDYGYMYDDTDQFSYENESKYYNQDHSYHQQFHENFNCNFKEPLSSHKNKTGSMYGFKNASYSKFSLNKIQCQFIKQTTGGQQFKSLYN